MSIARTAGASPAPRALGPLRVAAAPMTAVTVVLLLVAGRYGPHWDELYFALLPPAWWYVDQPPLTVWLTWLMGQISDALWVQRLPAIAAAAAGALVAGMFPRVLGAGPRTQRLAAWAHAFTVYPLLMGHVFTTAAIDLLAWQVIILLVLRATAGQPRMLLWAGVAGGVACWNKLLVVVLLVAIFVALCITDRRLVRSGYAVAGGALCAAIAAPQLIAQLANGLPMAQVSAGLTAEQGTLIRLVVLPALALFIGPPLVRVWFDGIAGPWRSRAAGRFVLPALLIVLAFTFAFPSQPYYPVGAALPALAMGWASPRVRRRWGPGKKRIVVAANAVVACLICLPVVPANSVLSRVNPSIRDQIGWPGLAAQVADARRGGEDIVADSYALAGAVHRFGGEGTRSAVYSGQNALWDLGPPVSDRVLLVGRHAAAHADSFTRCTPAGRLAVGPVVHPDLRDVPMLHCEGPVTDWQALWPQFRRLSG